MEMEDCSGIANYEWYRWVKTDGKNFHCFLCVRNIFSVVDAEQHIADQEHISKFPSSNCSAQSTVGGSENETVSLSLRDRLKCNYVRSEDLHLWAVEGAELLDVDSDGEIFCLLCEDYVEITELPIHCADSSLHADVKRAIIRLCDDVRTDGTLFYCLQCNCELPDSKRLKEHIVVPTHASHYPEVQIGLLQNAYELLFVQCEIKSFTADDLKGDWVVGENAFVEYVDVESDGQLYCFLCHRYLKFTVLSEHFEDDCGGGSSHKKIIDNIDNNLLKYVKTLGGNGGVYYYCFLCSCEMFSVNNVKLHISSKNHAYRYLTSQERPLSISEFRLELLLTESQYDYDLLLFLDERGKFCTITKDDLSRLLAGDKDDFFDIADGRIRCEPCNEEYASVSCFVTHCAGSVNHRIGNAIYRLCAEIRMVGFGSQKSISRDNDDGNADDNNARFWFCCLKCGCRMGDRNSLKTHIFGKPHGKQCSSDAPVEKETAIDRSYDFFVDRFPFKLITVDDLERIVDDAHLLQFLNVNSKGLIYCVLCGTFVDIFDADKQHFNSDLKHKKYVSRVQMLRENIKLVSDGGRNEAAVFYCFVCFSKICGRQCLAEHVTRKCANRLEFKLLEFAYDWLVRERLFQFERVTKEDLKSIVGDADEMEFFEFQSRSDKCNKIYCSLCELSLDISILREHSNKNRKHRESVSSARSLRNNVKMVGDKDSFCFPSPPGEIGNIGHRREHVQSRHRSSLGALPDRTYELASRPAGSKFRSITKEDLKQLTADPLEYFDTRPDGTIYCSLCTDVVTMTALQKHCRSSSHLGILSHVNDYLYGKVKLIVCQRQVGDGKRSYYCRLCCCELGSSLPDLKEHIGVDGRHASIFHRSENRLPDYIVNDLFLRRLKFENIATTNDFENELAIVRRLCEEIRVDRSEHYYCIRCSCPITNGRPIEHVTGISHVSKCPHVSKKSITSVRHLLNDFSFQFETLSINDLPKMLQTNRDCFTVNAGRLYCQPCARPINMMDANKHSLDLLTHKKFVIERLCDDIRTVGVGRFYCFRCSCPLLSFANAVEHAIGARHYVRDGRLALPAEYSVADFTFKHVTREHLKPIVDDIRFFDVDTNNGEIRCKDCNYVSVDIGTLRQHASTHTLTQKKDNNNTRTTDLIKVPQEAYVPVESRENLLKNDLHVHTDVNSSGSSGNTRSKLTSITQRNQFAPVNNVEQQSETVAAAGSGHVETFGIDLRENEKNSVRYLCEAVITECSKFFYCLCCSCPISGRKPAVEHIVGAHHLSVLKVAQNKFSSVKKLLLSLLPSYRFRMITSDDLRQILDTNVDWFTVVKDTGQVCCQICEELVPVTSVKKHAQRLSFHKNRHIERIYDDIRTNGDQFYCIRCSRPFSGIRNAVSHAVSAEHTEKYHYTPPTLYPTDIKFKNATKKEYLSLIAREWAERFDTKDDLGRRLCEVVINCFEHFYCLRCSSVIGGERNVLSHITGENHLIRFGIAKGTAAQELLRASSFSSYQFRRITVDDLSLILKKPGKPEWLTVEVDTGRIFCEICKLTVSIYELKEHARTHSSIARVDAVKNVRDDIKKPINGDAHKTPLLPEHVVVRENFKQRVTVATASSTTTTTTEEEEGARSVIHVKNDGAADAIKHVAENRQHNANPVDKNDVGRLCEAVVAVNCHGQFYCLSCSCEITGEKNVLQHITGGAHLSCSGLATGNIKCAKEELHSVLSSSYKFRTVTVDDLQLIPETKKAKWLTVIPGTGQILCNVCKLPVGEQHAKRSSPAATDNGVRIDCDIRMVGANRFYCFRCCCLLSPIRNAIKHAIKAQHISADSKFDDSQLPVKDYKFKRVTTEQLKLIVNGEAKCFGIDRNNGQIFCAVCRYDVHIMHLKSHVNHHLHQSTKICQQLCENVCRIADSSDYFFCSLCVLKIFSLNNARQHVLSSDHMAHFYHFNEIAKKRNEYISLWDHFKFK